MPNLSDIIASGSGAADVVQYTAPSGLRLDAATATFALHSIDRRVEPLDERFTVFQDTFEAGSQIYGGTPTEPAMVGGVWTFQANGQNKLRRQAQFKIPFLGVGVRVADMSDNATASNVAVGISTSNESSVFVGQYNAATSAAYFYAATNNYAQGQDNIASVSVSLVAPFELATTFTDRSVALWVNEGGRGWRVLTRTVLPAWFPDLRNSDNLATFQPYLYTYAPSGSGFALNGWRACYAGGVGVANIANVQFEDGTPFIQGRYAYLMCSVPQAPGAPEMNVTIPASYASIFRFDLQTGEMHNTAKIVTKRGSLLFGENSGIAVWDRVAKKYIIMIASAGDGWIDAPVHIYKYETTDDILNGVHVLDGATQLNIGNSTAEYDPSLVKMDDGLWHLSYTVTDVAQNWTQWRVVHDTSPDLTTWTRVADPGTYFTGGDEGAKFVKMGGEWTIWTAGVVNGFGNVRVRELDLTLVRTFATATNAGFHPNVLLYPEGGKTKGWLTGFDTSGHDGYLFAWGNFHLYRMNETQDGHEWPVLELPHRAIETRLPRLSRDWKFVTHNGADALKNKTLVSPVVSTATASTLAKFDGSKVLGSAVAGTDYVSPTGVETLAGVVFTKVSGTAIGLHTATSTTIFTVPTGKTFVLTGGWVRINSVIGYSGAPSYRVKGAAVGAITPTYSPTHLSATNAGAVMPLAVTDNVKPIPAGEAVQFEVTGASASTLLSAHVYLTGFYY